MVWGIFMSRSYVVRINVGVIPNYSTGKTCLVELESLRRDCHIKNAANAKSESAYELNS